jgi:hypothetical protein
MQFSPASCYFIPLGLNILFSTLFSNTLNLCYFFNVTDQVWHPYKTKDKIIILYILFCMFLDGSREDKHSELHGSKHSLHLISS